jgi:hypothetical protein
VRLIALLAAQARNVTFRYDSGCIPLVDHRDEINVLVVIASGWDGCGRAEGDWKHECDQMECHYEHDESFAGLHDR